MQTNLENRIETLEQNLKIENNFNAYNLCKLDLENIYDKKAQNDLGLFLENDSTLFVLTLQAGFLGFLNVDSKLLLLQIHLFLSLRLGVVEASKYRCVSRPLFAKF